MAAGQVQIDRRVGQLGVSEQHLNGAKIRTGFKQVVAKLCRNVWGETRLVIPAAFAASVTAIQATFVVTGTSARQLFSMPGKR